MSAGVSQVSGVHDEAEFVGCGLAGLEAPPVDAEAAPNQTADQEAVNLSSVHQAKGLEYHTVFVIWLTDGMFPSSRSLETRDAIEEERRLFYVAVTRARDELYLTYPHMRLNAGYGDVFQRPSRFLKEIPTNLVEDWQVRRA